MDRKQLARRAQYQEQLKNMAPRGAITITFGGDPGRALQTLLEENPGRGEHYVYLHRGARDEVFYVGKGKGDRAYSKDRDELWHHYLKTRCNDCYEVQIVKRFETDDEALECESDLIALFGEHIVNRINTGRNFNYKILALFHQLRKANWADIAAAVVLEKTSPSEAEKAFRKAVENMARYARLTLETGLFAELSAEVFADSDCHLNAQDLAALNHLTTLLKSQARWLELITLTDSFFEQYPETREQGIAKKIIKRADAARSRLGT